MKAEALPNRQSIRKRGWDYTAAGWYFVTINTHRARPWFGVIVNGKMILNEMGRLAEEEWRKSASIRPGIVLDECVIMPDHMHGLVRLPEGRQGPQGRDASRPYACGAASGSLGALVAGYKAAVSRQARRRGLAGADDEVWHRNYWDVIVSDAQALANIRRYIRNNPQNAMSALQASEPKFVGNRALWDRPKIGFLASRGPASPHGRLDLKANEAILSGFLSPMERALFKSGLAKGKPMIWVKPWGLNEGLDHPATRRAMDDGRLLVVSPFDAAAEAPSARRAAWCNQYVLAHGDRIVVGHLTPGGMLACLLSEAKPDMEIIYL